MLAHQEIDSWSEGVTWHNAPPDKMRPAMAPRSSSTCEAGSDQITYSKANKSIRTVLNGNDMCLTRSTAASGAAWPVSILTSPINYKVSWVGCNDRSINMGGWNSSNPDDKKWDINENGTISAATMSDMCNNERKVQTR